LLNKVFSYEFIEMLGYSDVKDDLKNGRCPECHKMVDVNLFTDRYFLMQFLLHGHCQQCVEKEMKGIEECKEKKICYKCGKKIIIGLDISEIELGNVLNYSVCVNCQRELIAKIK